MATHPVKGIMHLTFRALLIAIHTRIFLCLEARSDLPESTNVFSSEASHQSPNMHESNLDPGMDNRRRHVLESALLAVKQLSNGAGTPLDDIYASIGTTDDNDKPHENFNSGLLYMLDTYSPAANLCRLSNKLFDLCQPLFNGAYRVIGWTFSHCFPSRWLQSYAAA